VFSALEREWQQLVAAQPQVVLDMTSYALGAERSLVALTPGGIFRSEREIRALARLRELGVSTGLLDSPTAIDTSKFSPQAQKLLRHVGGISHFEEVFFGAYIVPMARTHGADLTIDLGPAVKGIISKFAATA